MVTSQVIWTSETLISSSISVGIGSNFHSVLAFFINFNNLYPDHSLCECIWAVCGFEPAGVHQKPPIIVWNITRCSSFPSMTFWVNELWPATPSSYHDETGIVNTLWIASGDIYLSSKVGLDLSSTCHWFFKRFHFLCFFKFWWNSLSTVAILQISMEFCVLWVDWKNFR